MVLNRYNKTIIIKNSIINTFFRGTFDAIAKTLSNSIHNVLMIEYIIIGNIYIVLHSFRAYRITKMNPIGYISKNGVGVSSLLIFISFNFISISVQIFNFFVSSRWYD